MAPQSAPLVARWMELPRTAARGSSAHRAEARRATTSHERPRDLCHRLAGDAEVFEEFPGRSVGAEILHVDRPPLQPQKVMPALTHPGLDDNPAAYRRRDDSSRYEAGCASNHSRHGMETTRARIDSAARARAASMATHTLDPVAVQQSGRDRQGPAGSGQSGRVSDRQPGRGDPAGHQSDGPREVPGCRTRRTVGATLGDRARL